MRGLRAVEGRGGCEEWRGPRGWEEVRRVGVEGRGQAEDALQAAFTS